MKGHPVLYSRHELAWIEANARLRLGELHAAFVEEFIRPDVTKMHLKDLRKRRGWTIGHTGHFAKGTTPWNTGLKLGPDFGSPATRFKPGQRSGGAAALLKPVGFERISSSGYRERKIHDGLPLQSRWRAVHLIEWEAVHGPIPKGHCLKCLSADRLDTRPANWACVPRAMLPRLAGGNRYARKLAYDEAPTEIKPAILAIAKLEYAARKARRGTKPEACANEHEQS